jgi:hypothetical protein
VQGAQNRLISVTANPAAGTFAPQLVPVAASSAAMAPTANAARDTSPRYASAQAGQWVCLTKLDGNLLGTTEAPDLNGWWFNLL